MKTADKLLNVLVKNHSENLNNSLPYKDARILHSLCKSINGDTFITENQAKLLIKIFKENQKVLKVLDDEFADIVADPTWSQPFRPQDTTKKVYIGKINDDAEAIVIEFAYSSSIRKKVQSLTKTVSGMAQVQSGKMFYADFTEKNIVTIVDELKEFNFVIEERVKNFYDTIKSWDKNVVRDQFLLTNIVHDTFQKQITADLGIDTAIDIHKILQLLPHRYPFLLVDRVLEITPRETITALKNVTMNEPFFQGHFPDFPVMPGVLIIEALAQTAALLTFSEERAEDAIYYFAGIDGARFKKPVLPGDQLIMTARLERGRAGIYKFAVQATVDGEIAAEANITCAVRSKGA